MKEVQESLRQAHQARKTYTEIRQEILADPEVAQFIQEEALQKKSLSSPSPSSSSISRSETSGSRGMKPISPRATSPSSL